MDLLEGSTSTEMLSPLAFNTTAIRTQNKENMNLPDGSTVTKMSSPLAFNTTVIRTRIKTIWTLPEGSTSTEMSSPLLSMQRRPTLKWVCHSTLLYIPTLKFIPATRNMLWTKEMHPTLRLCVLNCEKWATWEKSTHLKGILIRTCYVYN